MTRRLAKALSAVAVAVLATATPASAIDHSKGRPGFCSGDTGVTVVVDFQQLGGTTIVRCFPGATAGTGLDALKGAGFQVAGVQRWGEAFICRVENRPSAVEVVPVNGREKYRELCLDTPPAGGYWSYWHAGNNCSWTYSQWGVKNRQFIPGGFEGWSYSLNATADSNPVPRVAPVRPGTEGRLCNAPEEVKPNTNDPNERQQPAPPAGERPRAESPATTPKPAPGTPEQAPAPTEAPVSSERVLPPPKPRPSSAKPDPAQNVAFTGGEGAADVNQLIKDQSGSSDYAPWVAAGAVVLLAGATVFTARRRRRARES
ncbi:ABC transporter substrate-binding protein [Actinokineospora cianjurensis]|uniref:LPXTG-motif cell wall-anchored protein n=1 Tax=Actinokineospora cianjurensis TaxID=585224 RepID=A0A421B2N9_9PSEU|nr:ABC transporter substrate-binding protein [Actinokineospora cianjurensis]RLK58528.1 hypothetical protein CLV68_2995 [Actinokineospora cianjurensis]